MEVVHSHHFVFPPCCLLQYCQHIPFMLRLKLSTKITPHGQYPIMSILPHLELGQRLTINPHKPGSRHNRAILGILRIAIQEHISL